MRPLKKNHLNHWIAAAALLIASIPATMADPPYSPPQNKPQPKILFLQPQAEDETEIALMPSAKKIQIITDTSTPLQAFTTWLSLTTNSERWIEKTTKAYAQGKIDGIIGTDDFSSSILAAFVGKKLGLKVPDPGVMLRFGNKFHSRQLQETFVPEATPRFALVDPENPDKTPPLPFPFFLKPVRGTVSMGARVIHNQKEFEAALHASPFFRASVAIINRPFDQLAKTEIDEPALSHCFVAEELLGGQQITFDGYVQNGEPHMIGIVDSFKTPGSISFSRFELPSKIPANIQERMFQIASKLMKGTGFDNSIFNIEMFYDPKADTIKIIEVNPRMSIGFSDLYERTTGLNLYEIQAQLALGKRVTLERRAGKYDASAAFVLRKFPNQVVEKAATKKGIASLRKKYPDFRFRFFSPGCLGVLNPYQDEESQILMLANIGAKGDNPEQAHENLMRLFDQVVKDAGLALKTVN